MAATAVTPAGVRDGDPGALAALCELRGPAVLAYCEVIAGHGSAGAAAAADAFARFRAGVAATTDLATLNPETVLISATRHAAARYAGGDLPASCARVPVLLAARADRSITLADNDWLQEHLAGCWTCRAPVARFEAADRAYIEPPGTSVEPATATAIVAAMTAAAPLRGGAPAPEVLADPTPYAQPQPAAAPANGYGAHPRPALGDAGSVHETAHPAEHSPPTESYAAHDVPAPDHETRPHVVITGTPDAGVTLPPQTPDSGDGRGRRRMALGMPARRKKADRPAPPARESAAGRMTRSPRGQRGPRTGTGARGNAVAADVAADRNDTSGNGPAAADAAFAAGAAAAAGQASARAASGTSLPRPQRVAATSSAGTSRASGVMRPAVVLPIVLVILAILGGLTIAGVFGGGDPASAPQSFAPSTTEPQDTAAPPPVVVVPGADQASAADIERAKAKARAAKRRAAAADEPDDAAAPPPAPAATTPPPAATNTAAATPTPPPPPPPATKAKPTGKGSAAPGIDADNGATGAEQPSTGDTSTVPELAPPVVPAQPPG